MIKVRNLTLQYPSKKGIFDINFDISEGQTLGYLGPNGAGKTTTIRALLGFMKPNKGSCTINNLDCFSNASQIQKILGYIPGEITFLNNMTGNEFLKMISDMRKTYNTKLQKELIEMFELDISGKINKFSKGMKQKLGIVTAFMHDPQILILDEPTSGLDPLMQNRFINLIINQKKKGKTILMSSHIFEEIEKTCDNVAIIKDGFIVKLTSINNLKTNQIKCYKIKPKNLSQAKKSLENYKINQINNYLEVFISGTKINEFIKTISKLDILDLDSKKQTLEDIFMNYYKKENK